MTAYTTAYTTLVSARQLQDLLEAKAPAVLVDTSFDLADLQAGETAWRTGHLPGAHYLSLERDLSGAKTGRNGRHPLPERAAFAATLGRLGITPQTQVVAMDRQGGVYASRLWWMLRWVGHETAAVLDGGVAAWTAAGGTLESSPPKTPAATDYPLRDSRVAQIGSDELAVRLGTVRLLDARSGERFRGEVEPLDKAAGHIPGALHRFFKDNLAADGGFKPASQLRAEFVPLLADGGAGNIVHSCGSGVTACHSLLAMEHAGLTGSVLYPGSWSEWSSDPARPIATG